MNGLREAGRDQVAVIAAEARLRELRKQFARPLISGLVRRVGSTRRLAKLTGMSETYISLMRSGKSHMSGNAFVKLMEVYDGLDR